jgi:hypothetical protein
MAIPSFIGSSILLGFASLVGTVALRLTLPPDTSLYLHGGSWFYPSPLGRALGYIGGYAGLAFVTVLAAFYLPRIVARIAEDYGRDPSSAAWGIIKYPAVWYLAAVSIDGIAALFLVSSLAMRSKKTALPCLAIACMLHLALLPSVLAIAGIKYLRGVSAMFAVAACGALAFAYMVATPYGLLVSNHVNLLTFAWTGTATFAVGVLPSLIHRAKFALDSLTMTALAVCAIGGLESALQQHFQPRYCLAGALLMAAAFAKPVKVSQALSYSPARTGIPATLSHERG